MIVRTFQLQDYIEVSTLLENTISDSCMEKAIASFAKQLYVDSDLILIAQKNNQVIAVIMGTIQQRQGKCFLIVVEQNHVNIGIEKALLEALRSRFQTRDVRGMEILLEHQMDVTPKEWEETACLQRISGRL
jgi:predicted N-acetyltransferase YhbS